MDKLAIGDKAPDFALEATQGGVVSNNDLKGQRYILYFYPKDNTSGCTLEARSMREGKERLAQMGLSIYGVSPDNIKSHENFCQKEELNFTLLSDPDKKAATAFGVWAEKKMYGRTYMGIRRTTFVVDENGLIEKIFEKVDTKNHWQQIVDSYKQQ